MSSCGGIGAWSLSLVGFKWIEKERLIGFGYELLMMSFRCTAWIMRHSLLGSTNLANQSSEFESDPDYFRY